MTFSAYISEKLDTSFLQSGISYAYAVRSFPNPSFAWPSGSMAVLWHGFRFVSVIDKCSVRACLEQSPLSAWKRVSKEAEISKECDELSPRVVPHWKVSASTPRYWQQYCRPKLLPVHSSLPYKYCTLLKNGDAIFSNLNYKIYQNFKISANFLTCYLMNIRSGQLKGSKKIIQQICFYFLLQLKAVWA